MPRSQKFLIVKPWSESCAHAALLASTFAPRLVGELEDEIYTFHFDHGDQEEQEAEGVIVASVRKDEHHCELALGVCTVATDS